MKLLDCGQAVLVVFSPTHGRRRWTPKGECVVSRPEICNEVDDDGDGVVDEGPPADNQGVYGEAQDL